MDSNPLFNLLVTTFHSVRQIRSEDVIQFIVNFPRNYDIWWRNLLKEAPQHVLIETTLVMFIIWLLFIRRTVDPKKTSGAEKLSQREIDWLIETWQPDPLVPQLNEKEKLVAQDMKIIEEINNDQIVIRGLSKPVLNASSFDFLGLSNEHSVKQAARDALDTYGCGSCGPRGFYGTIDQHLILEQAIAKFLNAQEAICYSEGASTICSAIPAFSKKGDLLLVDEACSEPIMTGVNLSRSTVRYFRHNDLAHLESILEAIAAEDKKLKRDTLQQRRFIVVESVYRNVGDICPLKEMIALKEKFCYRMVLDETYAFGLLGKTGRGLTEHVGIETSQVEVITITMDTALSSVGGVCIGSREIVDHQRLSGAGYCFSASLAPFLCAGAVAALKKIQSEPVLISKFQSVAKKLTEVLSKVPKMVLLAKDTTGIVHLSLATKLSAVEESRVLKEITEKALQNGVAVTTSKYSVLHSKSLRPSIMVCANVNWTDETIKKIGDSITKAVNSTI